MKQNGLELFVGLFMVLGFLAFGYLALQLGEVEILSAGNSYVVNAEFDNISGVKKGAAIQIAGVVVGQVQRTWLGKDELAHVALQIDKGVKVPVDSMASVKTQGIIGDKYIQLSLGGDEKLFVEGDVLTDTESAVDLESLISKFAFGSVEKK
ncbi:MAG: outer membrane lipid asymmetry maintenance protein MlaD [Proteobacteria bacterium]|nr:outer membrane lipid asymmetry maintenance protein MlaD [Desulfocapsa sp.]MBU3945720.1 outer membrane lipid asymmetry maintenance protein MlaD [Pseudomonadota bacterium]MCG2745043.1 outer membrane lipid asymmetry maintenance protein MlaD [Desulfobacteraceae bacterium]MBU3982838.1 outer membrane lipid asymmetry maintenance protein MlaD [Pseudomonadota bacterium]MBU4027438.1 outer membrane lipid asymmetry maintenance protein MlaD [Pseudomonadota bacterium]